MTATWDLFVKDLVRERPQDFATLILPGSRYIGRRESQYQMREIRMDRLIEVELEGVRLLINFEIQATKDGKMGIRLLRYSLEAMDEYELPVLSCVIYLQKIGELDEPPLHVEILKGKRVLWFDYISIELAKKTLEELQQMNLIGLLPLFILSKDGKTHEVLDQVVDRLEMANENDLLLVTKMIAEHVFKANDEQSWLRRRFAMLQDIENTPTYQRIMREGLERGLKQGLKQGREEGELLGARKSIEAIVQTRFPTILLLARVKIEQITDLDKLQDILVQMSGASDAMAATQYLLSL
jgi:predicted transposase YdaD